MAKKKKHKKKLRRTLYDILIGAVSGTITWLVTEFLKHVFHW